MPVYRISFCDRDFPTASPGVYAILCLCKERLCQESTLRGLRREVRFIMSPPGKRRHNELNAAPPPETPRGTGKPGETTDRENVHSGESFRVRVKAVRSSFPFEGKPRRMFAAERLIIRTPTCPRCAACTEPFPLIPHAVVVSPPCSGGQGGIPLAALSFRVFLSPEKEKRIGSDDVGKSLS